ncbi:MAG: ABC transporter permease [Bacteroidales bacterium]|nr:ABC transporter permease [Bacteroidales bacterium]
MKVFRKTGVSTLINILGMSVAFAAAMILMVQVKWDTTYDANFKGHEQVFRLENNWMDKGLFSTSFSRPMIEIAKTASPNIEAVGTYWTMPHEATLKKDGEETVLSVPSARVDSSMFSVFPFEWVEGSAREFTAGETAVVSEEYAKLFFGDESAIGKIFKAGNGVEVRVVGVFKDMPKNYSMHYGVLVNMGDDYLDDSNEWSFPAFVKLKDPSLAKEIETQMVNTLLEYVGDDVDEAQANEFRKGFRIVYLHEAHFERDVRANIASANKAITITLAAIAILLILIAIINFINFAFAEIPFRIKSINTRKVLGEGRGSLIGRQLLHAGLIALIAFAIACLIMHVVAGTSWASYVSDSLALKDNIGILVLMLGVALVSAVIAGLAPALYSTSQPAALVLKGSYGTSVKGKALRNILVGLQFVLSFLFILMALFVGVQTKYMIGKDMGFDEVRVLQTRCGYPAGNQKDALRSHLLQNPSIEDVTFCDSPIVSEGKMGWSRTGDDGNQVFMEVLPVDDNFVQFFGLQIVEGRDFRESDNQNEAGSIIPNETFMQMFPQFHVGSLMYGHVDNCEIVGVVKDFNFKSLQHAMGPIVLYNWGKEGWRSFGTMYVRTVPGADFKDVSDSIKDAICKFDPRREPDMITVSHLDKWIEDMYQSEQSLGKLISIASFVALLIAIIGIIGLVFFETQFIRKEIAVRRVNGATVGSILKMINKKYLIMAAASFVIAAPVAYWLMTAWRKGFAYQAPVPVWIFLVALLAVAAITLAVVTLQSWRAANVNPVDSLKNE